VEKVKTSAIRIPTAIGQTSSKNTGRDKNPRRGIAATGKRSFWRDSGIVNILLHLKLLV